MIPVDRKAFTMIELIFVIVIIGILSAVAMSKLAATRDDARISNIIANTRTVLGDITAFHTSQGTTNFKNASIADATNVPLYSGSTCAGTTRVATSTSILGTFYLCEDLDTTAVITFVIDANATNLNVAAASDDISKPVLHGVVNEPSIVGITGGAGQNKDYKLAGASVLR